MYFDRRSGLEKDEFEKLVEKSTTLYIGNLSTTTSESQILALFERCGEIKNFHMGLVWTNNPEERDPCGFCFVEYYNRQDAQLAFNSLNWVTIDKKPIRVNFDYGFKEGR